jgi:glutathione S-transferase
MLIYTALVTLAALFVYFWFCLLVGKARVQYKVAAPAVTGDPAFERLYRVQMNTLEWLPIFLPSLWLFAFYISDVIAALLGLVWIVGRILYKNGYEQAAEKRSLGFGIQALAAAVLAVGALIELGVRLVASH